MVPDHAANAIVLHGGYQAPEEFLRDHPVGRDDDVYISLPSVYSLPWAKQLLSLLAESGYARDIVCGGRWVINGRECWIADKLAYPRLRLISGLGETFMAERFGLPLFQWEEDYTLMPDYQQFHPSVEVSRGCGRGCAFCVEGAEPRDVIRDGVETASRMWELEQLYESTPIRPYLEASLFKPTGRWMDEFAMQYAKLGVSTKWRTETRVDSLQAASIQRLAASGLRVLDLGLESAAPGQLIAMRKCKDPFRYLDHAGVVLEACKRAGVLAKLNIVLYPGESKDSYAETLRWLRERRDLIAGVSASPLVYYPRDTVESRLPSQLLRLGASLVEETQPERLGYGDLHLSRTITNGVAQRLCTELAQEFMDARQYFTLKSFAYFSPQLSYAEFIGIASADDPTKLAFRMSE